MTALNFQTPDRIPTSYEFFWSEFIVKWRKKKGISSEVDINDWYGSDIIIEVADETFFPSQRKLLKEENGYIFQNDGWGRRNEQSFVRLEVLLSDLGLFEETLY